MTVRSQETHFSRAPGVNDESVDDEKFSQCINWARYTLCCSYRLIKISEKGAVFLIIFNFLLAAAWVNMWQLMFIHGPSPSSTPSLALTILVGAIALSAPIIGILSECYFGRYKIITLSLYPWMSSIILSAIGLILPSDVCLSLGFFAMSSCMACYVPCILPFTIDQLVGASGEELSFTIYWMVWCWDTCASVANLCVCLSQLAVQIDMQQAVWFLIPYVAFVIAFVMCQCCSHVLMTSPQLSNPIKLILQVLNYARKHRFPVRRSAFTYWEDECPSRIDLGKSKYGGPFTLEEVENVKTILKLFPLISCVSVMTVLGGGMPFQSRSCNTSNKRFYSTVLQGVISICCLPTYHFLVYPLFHNHIPRMLRRIGIGLFVILLSHLLNLVVELIVAHEYHMKYPNATVTTHLQRIEEFPVSECLLLFSTSLCRLALTVTGATSVEFFMAQAPFQVRGFVASMLMACCESFLILRSILHYNMDIAYIIAIALMAGVFLIFVLISKWYKLRKRDDIIPYHMFAEDQFESDYRQEQKWLRERTNFE